MAEERISIIVEESGSRVVQRNLQDIGGAATSSATGVSLLRRALMTVGVGLTIENTLRTVIGYEHALSSLRVVSTATESDFARLSNAAKELGISTKFSAAQVLEGFTMLTRAGFSVEEQLKSIKGAADLAAAGHMELTAAAHVTAITLRSFRLGMDQSSRVTDIFARVANMTTADVGLLAQAMKFVGPAAAGYKVSLEETAAAMSILMETGLGSRQAGTGFRTIISDLEAPNARMRQVLRSLNVDLNSVKVSQVGLISALRALRSAGVGAAGAMALFGDMNGQVLDTLIKSLPELQRYGTILGQSEGYASRAAKILRDNLGGALDDVRSAVEALQISFGKLGASSILVQVARGLSEAILFLANHIEILDGALVAITIGSLPRAISLLKTLALSALGSWPILIGAAIGALIAFRNEIKMSADSSTTLGDFFSAAGERIKSSGQTVIEFLQTRFTGITTIFDGINFSLEGMVRFTARALDWWIGLWRGAINAIEALFINLGPFLKEVAIDILNDIISITDAGLRKFYELLGNIPGRAGAPYRRLAEEGIIPRLENDARGATERLGIAVANGYIEGFKQITIFEDSVNAMFDRADEIAKERLAKQTQPAAEGLPTATAGGAAPTPEETLPRKLNQFDMGVSSGLEKISQTIFNFSTQIETTLVSAFGGAEDALVSFVTTGRVNFKAMVDGILGDLTRLVFRMALSGLMESLVPGASKAATLPGRAGGGSVYPGQFYEVGERGREIFTPSVPGRIISNDQISQASVSGTKVEDRPVNVTVLNVKSMDEALAAMRSREGQKIILNAGGAK